MTLQRRVPWSGLTIDPKLCDAGAPSPGLWEDRLNLSFGSDLVPAKSCMHNMIGPCHASQPFSVLPFYTFFFLLYIFYKAECIQSILLQKAFCSNGCEEMFTTLVLCF